MEKTSGLIPREQNNMQGGCDAAERIAGGPTLAASLLGFSCRTQILSIMLIAVASLSSYSLCFQTFCGGVKSPVCVSTLGSFLSHFSFSLLSTGRDRNYSLLSFCFLLWF